MVKPGVYTLAALEIGDTIPPSLLTFTEGLDGMSAVSLDVKFNCGGGAGAVTVIIVTSFDQGATLRQVARFEFAGASATKTANLSGLISRGVAAYAELAAEGVNDGMLGDRLAVLLTVAGSFEDSNLVVRASVR